jgi:uncharacterized phage-like protein YoqJ
MQIAMFKEIRNKFKIDDESFYIYTIDEDRALKIRTVNEYEIFTEEGLKEIYDNEPEGIWEKCLEDE